MARSPGPDGRFRRVFLFLRDAGLPYVLVGGVPAGYLGEPRSTLDVDLITFLPPEGLERLAAFFRRRHIPLSLHRIRKDIAVDSFFRAVIHGLQVDFIVGSTAFEFSVLSRRMRGNLFGVPVQLASPEDMILMKVVSGRPQDLVDAKAILMRHAKTIDWKYVNNWAGTLNVQRGRGKAARRLAKLIKAEYRD